MLSRIVPEARCQIGPFDHRLSRHPLKVENRDRYPDGPPDCGRSPKAEAASLNLAQCAFDPRRPHHHAPVDQLAGVTVLRSRAVSVRIGPGVPNTRNLLGLAPRTRWKRVVAARSIVRCDQVPPIRSVPRLAPQRCLKHRATARLMVRCRSRSANMEGEPARVLAPVRSGLGLKGLGFECTRLPPIWNMLGSAPRAVC